MALRVSPEVVRDVRFAEQWRGYRTDEVDEFVEQVADAFDQLEHRLAEATQRTTEAERRLAERGDEDDLARTLVLAQRTADAARQEAEEEAARLVSEAKAEAETVLTRMEERRAALDAEIEQRMQADLAEVNDRRQALEADVELLVGYVERHRARLADELRAQLGWLERAGHLDALPLASKRVEAEAEPTSSDQAQSEQAQSDQAPPMQNVTPPPPKTATPPKKSPPPPPPPAPSPPPPSPPASSPPPPPAKESSTVSSRADGIGDDDDTALDKVGVIPWGSDSNDDDDTDGNLFAASDDDDPFIAELRRAVDDPEPLGPRDDPLEWDDKIGVYDRDPSLPSPSRRRKRS